MLLQPLISYTAIIFVAVVIGFDATDYRVDENVQSGVVVVNVTVQNGSLQRDVEISLSTNDSTAICKSTLFCSKFYCIIMHSSVTLVAEEDYVEVINRIVTLNSSTKWDTVNIMIIHTNDTEIEQDEYFTVRLRFPGEPIRGVTLNPNQTTIEIVEFDGTGKSSIHTHTK